jgi:hypothetical protein
MEGNFQAARGRLLRGSIWRVSHHDETDRLRSLMAQNRKSDRRLLSDLPRNRRTVVQAFRRSWWLLGKQRVGVAIASVLSPMEWHVQHSDSESAGPPIGSRELLDHVRSLQLDGRVPHVIGVCSPTGFTPEARQARSELAHVTVVLVEPDTHGGWEVSGADDLDSRVRELFDPENVAGKKRRVLQLLEASSADLLTGGLSASEVAQQMNLPVEIVEQAFRDAADGDAELRSSWHDGALLIYRGAVTDRKETASMSMVERIRQLFGRSGSEAEKINELSRRRAALAQRRNKLYDGIIQLEKREADLLEQGRQNKSPVVRRRVAAQLAQLRKDIQRQNATTAMLNKQIDILSTDIHNLTLLQQGHLANLPSSESLTENAVAAEEMLESLQADAELVGSLGTGVAQSLTSDEELAILKEFDAQTEPAAPRISDARQRGEPAPQAPEALGDARTPPQEEKRPAPREPEAF